MNILFLLIESAPYIVMFLSFVNLKLAISIYFGYTVLVPYFKVQMFGVPLSYNFVNTVLVVATIIHFKLKGYSFSYQAIKVYIIFMLVLLLFIPFQTSIPYSTQLNYWRLDFMGRIMLPFLVWNLIINEKKTLEYLKWSVMTVTVVACLYGIYLTTTGNNNIYITNLQSKYGISTFLYKNDTRLYGRITSTFKHPMDWNNYLVLVFVFMAGLYERYRSIYCIPVIMLITLCILTGGVRSGFATLIIVVGYFLLMQRRLKVFIIIMFIMFGMYVVVSRYSALSAVLLSIADIEKQRTMIGSSVYMRLDQFNGSLNEISNCLFTGKGYGWTSWYMGKYKTHPVILAFESIVYVIICNWGLLGMIAWTIFFSFLFVVNRNIIKSKTGIVYADCLVVGFISYSVFTGDYYYFQYFALFHIILLGMFRSGNVNLRRQNVAVINTGSECGKNIGYQ